MAIGDFNHDGKNDVALSSASNVEVLLGNGDGTFNAAGGGGITSGPLQLSGATTNSVGYVAVSDFNSDGLPDMIFTNDHGLSRLYSVPAPTVSPTSLRWSPSNDSAVQVVTIKNTTTTAHSVRPVIADPAQSEYQITSNTCGSSLAAGATCKVSINTMVAQGSDLTRCISATTACSSRMFYCRRPTRSNLPQIMGFAVEPDGSSEAREYF